MKNEKGESEKDSLVKYHLSQALDQLLDKLI